MIYNIRGTHGSGKSECMRRLLAKHPYEDIVAGDQVLGLWVPSLNLRVIGTYEIPSGGCDWFIRMVPVRYEGQSPSEMMGEWVDVFHEEGKYNVLLEGFMVSGTFGRWNDMAAADAARAGRETWRFLCLDTPVEQCIAHVSERRQRRGKTAPFNPEHLIKHAAQVANNRQSFINAGRTVIDIPWKNSWEHVEKIIESDIRN
jgi:hypothetical protein